MSQHQQFKFKSSGELLDKASELGLELPFRENIDPLFDPIEVSGKIIPNRFAVQPMEGFDSELDGSPGELALRRYKRYAQGGSGLIWFEATSVKHEGRSNRRQLLLSTNTVGEFSRLIDITKRAAFNDFGYNHEPFLVLQLTHSGRYSKPDGNSEPLAACCNPHLDEKFEKISIIADDELDDLQEDYISAAGLARNAGFDAVDIKACHGYLIHDLLSSFTRENSKYGGELLQNRARFLVEIVEKIKTTVPGLALAVRLNLYDGLPYPYGFGVKKDGSTEIDLSEPIELIRMLKDAGVELLNGTMGIPYANPHIGRPYDKALPGDPIPPEHPLESISRFIEVTGEVQSKFKDFPIVGTGYSWLRKFYPNVGAAVIEKGLASFIGLGRASFAYPNAPKDLMDRRELDTRKVCIACSKCTEMMRHNQISGCVTRDIEIYAKEYKNTIKRK